MYLTTELPGGPRLRHGKDVQGWRSRKLELGGRARPRPDREGAHEGRELQRVRPSRQQGGASIFDQERQDRSHRPAQGSRVEASSPMIKSPGMRINLYAPSLPLP